MKHHLRTEMKARLAAMSANQIADKSYAACEKLLALQEYRDAKVLMIYLPMPQEVDAARIALRAWQAYKTVLAPKVNWPHRHMLAVRISSLDDDVVFGRLGVREPAAAEPWPISQIDLIVVPALAFDRTGRRLGRGGGHYDRFLTEPGMQAVTCGLAFEEQLIDKIPSEGHDHPVQILVTDQQVLRFKE